MMFELSPILRNETEPEARFRCHQHIVLGGVRYVCARRSLHGGAHDAHRKHPADGGLVRW
jgi:hypothetical protein